MTTKIERERKFVISGVRPAISWPVDYTVTKISQTYLAQERAGVVERIRVAEVDGRVEIILCMKEYRSPGVNQETEVTFVDITSSELMSLQERADRTRGTIQKERYTFDWNGLTYELDHFQSPQLVNALLEVELDDMAQDISIPPFLLSSTSGVREVTGEPKWTNHQIALQATDIHL